MHSASVDFGTMQAHLAEQGTPLLTMAELRERLAATEPLHEVTFPAGQELSFALQPGWGDHADGELTGAVLTTAHSSFSLTKKALLEAGAFCGIPRKYQERCPSNLLQDQLNYWFREGWITDNDKKEKTFKVLSLGTPNGTDNPTALAMTRGTIQPFSNVELLDHAVARIEAAYGAGVEVVSDYKFWHDLESTHYRLIVPGQSRIIENTGQPDDSWSAGIDIRNSLTGLKPPVIQGYLFRWWCTNGCADTLLSTGQFSRRGNHDIGDVWQWAENAVDEVLGGLEGSFQAVQGLTEISVADDVILVLNDLFSQYGIPQRERSRITQNLAAQEGAITLYAVMQAITQAANMDGLEQNAVAKILALGGHVTHAATLRCDADHPCRRLMPEGYQVPTPAVPVS
jgi:hypothetical protein